MAHGAGMKLTLKPIIYSFSLLAAGVVVSACSPQGQVQDKGSDTPGLISSQEAFKDAVSAAKPGDVLTLADGTYSDFEIIFKGEGTADAPITLTAQTPGKVILSGQSNLRMSGEHLIVSGLVFKDGYSPGSEVISFRTSADDLANNSRVTQTVIDDYNPPLRSEVDSWVMMYGKNNRFDHNHLAAKRNTGVTMAVRMNTPASRENNHRIDHNYFGPRQILGSNGGETLRIGTSHFSRSDSMTVVENNYFDRADGELEIISSKSGKNIIRNNTFYKSRGTLTMRHGNNTDVQGNVFFGENAEHTGGIRVINAGQNVSGNYMEGLKGTRFGGAFVVMNGVPNGPINRYDPVINATIDNNSIINSDNIQLGAGSDEERSGAPKDSTFSNNLIYNADGRDTFTIYDDMSGIKFSGNVISDKTDQTLKTGFEKKPLSLSRAANGLLYPDNGTYGAPRDLSVTQKADVGTSYYPKTEPLVAFGSGKTRTVSPGANALYAAIAAAEAGDTIKLAPGDYVASKFLKIDKPLSFTGGGTANITFERSALFEILDGGSLQLSGLNISGRDAPDNAGNSVIRTSPYSMLQNYRLEIERSKFTQMDINHSFNIFSAAKGTFADNIKITGSEFSDVTGFVMMLDQEADDYGIYNAEYLTITDSKFENIGKAVVSLYRGGTDESTFGPHFKMTGSSLKNIGGNKRNKTGASILLHGVQVTDMSDNVFDAARPIKINHTVGEPKTVITKNTFIATPDIEVAELNSAFENTAVIEKNERRSK